MSEEETKKQEALQEKTPTESTAQAPAQQEGTQDTQKDTPTQPSAPTEASSPKEGTEATKDVTKDDIKAVEAETEGKKTRPVTRGRRRHMRGMREPFNKENWEPKTLLGQAVKAGEVKDVGEILGSGQRILESEIVDCLLPDIESDLLMIGQAKGKFGGGQRRAFKQVQKKTAEGNKPKFATLAVVGNKDGYVGLGYGKAKETVPSREKAFRNAKLNLIRIRRGSGSWEDSSPEPNTIPFKVEGKCGSVRVVLMPAPGGTGLSIEKECAKMLTLAGIKDVWSKSYGHKKTKTNMLKACFEALKQLSKVKVSAKYAEQFSIIAGPIAKVEN